MAGWDDLKSWGRFAAPYRFYCLAASYSGITFGIAACNEAIRESSGPAGGLATRSRCVSSIRFARTGLLV